MRAAVRLRANAMGAAATVKLRLTAGRGEAVKSPAVSIGKWLVARDVINRIPGLRGGVAYKGTGVAAAGWTPQCRAVSRI